MAVHRKIPEFDGLYFITLTCADWLPLFHEADGYSVVYKWFDYLKALGHYIIGYVIMPNHLHAMIAFSHTQGKSINSIVSNGKRFMAYELVERLKAKGESEGRRRGTRKHQGRTQSSSSRRAGKKRTRRVGITRARGCQSGEKAETLTI